MSNKDRLWGKREYLCKGCSHSYSVHPQAAFSRFSRFQYSKQLYAGSQNDFPSSLNAVLKARIVLSASIAKNAEREFAKVKKEYIELFQKVNGHSNIDPKIFTFTSVHEAKNMLKA